MSFKLSIVSEIALCCGNLLYSIEYHHIHSSSFKKLDSGKKKRKEKQMQYKQPKMENSSIFDWMAIKHVFRNGVITA